MSVVKFRSGASIILGGLTGLLIGIPAASMAHGITGILAIFVFTALGVLIGYKRRSHSSFFYFTLIAVVVLSSILLRSGLHQ